MVVRIVASRFVPGGVQPPHQAMRPVLRCLASCLLFQQTQSAGPGGPCAHRPAQPVGLGAGMTYPTRAGYLRITNTTMHHPCIP